MQPVAPINIKKNMYVRDLIKEMSNSGAFGAGKIAKSVDILTAMIKDKECRVFFGLAGAMVPAGMKNIIIDMLKNKHIDILVTTGANITHDLIESLGHRHYQGSEFADDSELNKLNIDRIYNVYMEDKVYKDLENFITSLKDKFPNKKINICEFLREIGKNIENKDSILKVCYENKIPIFCRGIADCGLGQMTWMHLTQNNIIEVDAFKDLKEINELVWTAKKIGVVYIGGGVPKNYIQQATQFSEEHKNGADYGIQITTDRPESGGSSGAPLKEGISWGKMKPEGNHITVYCDATIALPLIYAGVKDNLKC
jgi:deoxyhypusine synthase